MNKLLFSSFILALAYQTLLGETWGDFTYTVANGEVTITAYEGAGGAVIIPATINELPVIDFGQSFSGSAITSATIPNSVKSIKGAAFQGCTSLITINIPNSVTSIESVAFAGCTSLVTIIIPNSVTSIGDSAFQSCTSLVTIVIPNSVTTIGPAAFFMCTSLVNITISSNVTYIGNSAFADCIRLLGAYFLGNSPTRGSGIFGGSTPTVYYLAGSTGWLPTYAGRPTALTGTYSLSLQYDSAKGSVELSPSQTFYSSGVGVTVQAIAKQGYVFGGWSGEYEYGTVSSGIILENFQVLHETTVIMNSNKSVGVTFLQDGNDSDSDGLTNFQESTIYSSNPYQADSNSDGYNDGQAVSLGYSPSINFSALISHLQSHPPTGLYTASQMHAMAFGDLVLTKNANGSFTLNYDIEQSTDLQSWSIYAPLSLPLTGLPTDKAFVRIKAKQ